MRGKESVHRDISSSSKQRRLQKEQQGQSAQPTMGCTMTSFTRRRLSERTKYEKEREKSAGEKVSICMLMTRYTASSHFLLHAGRQFLLKMSHVRAVNFMLVFKSQRCKRCNFSNSAFPLRCETTAPFLRQLPEDTHAQGTPYTDEKSLQTDRKKNAEGHCWVVGNKICFAVPCEILEQPQLAEFWLASQQCRSGYIRNVTQFFATSYLKLVF